MIRAKKRILFGILSVLAVWPLLHYVMVETFEMDRWRFCGFAMYATPSTYQWVHIIELRADREVNLHESWFRSETRKLFKEYLKKRSTLGKLAPPHELAEAILAELPDMEGLKIILIRDDISPRTSRIVPHPGTAYIYRR